jgi:hypothetical protein
MGQMCAHARSRAPAKLELPILKVGDQNALLKRVAIVLNREHQIAPNTIDTAQTLCPLRYVVNQVRIRNAKAIQQARSGGEVAASNQCGARKEALGVLHIIISDQKLTLATGITDSANTGLITKLNSSIVINIAGYI